MSYIGDHERKFFEEEFSEHPLQLENLFLNEVSLLELALAADCLVKLFEFFSNFFADFFRSSFFILIEFED